MVAPVAGRAKADELEKTKRAELNRDVELKKIDARARANLIDKGFRLFRSALWAAAAVFIAYFMYRSVAELAGKDTKINALLSTMFAFSINKWASWALTAIFGTGYFIKRRQHHKGIEQHAAHIKELEKRLASDRTSSGLTLDGRPRKKDLDNA